jgi:hypothetical protein
MLHCVIIKTIMTMTAVATITAEVAVTRTTTTKCVY